jgi:hypothetical protein
MIAQLNWHPALDTAPRGRCSQTGLRDAAAFAQDLPVAVAGGDPLSLAVIHVGRPGEKWMHRVAEQLDRLPGFPYRTGPDTFAILAPGVTPWQLQLALATVAGSCRRARLHAGVTVADACAKSAAVAALAALERAADERVSVAVV